MAHDTVALKGIIPIVPTCFDESGRLDPESQVRLVRYYLRSGVHGLALFGNASEYFALTGPEWAATLNLVCREVGGAVPVIVGVGGGDLESAVHQIRAAEDQGAAAIMLRPPANVQGKDPHSLLPYYMQLSLRATAPVILQDAFIQGQWALPTSLYATLAQMVDQLRYAKVEVSWTPLRFRQVSAAVGGRWRLFGGQNGQFLIEECRAGSIGSMVGSDLTPQYVSIWSCCQQKQWSQAWASFSCLLPLIRFQLQAGLGISAIKHNLVADGVIRCPHVRPPTPELEKYGIEELTFLRSFANVAAEASAA